MKRLFVALFFLLIAGRLFCQTEPREICKNFFEKYKLETSDEAIDYLFSNTPYAESIRDGIDDLKRQLKKQVGLIGHYYGADLIAQKTAGPNAIMFTYLVRHSVQPLMFYIMFYRPNTNWQMQSFKFNNKTSDELEDASKLDRLKENSN